MRLLRFLFLPAAVLLTAAPLASQLIPLGPEFRINSTSLQAQAPPVLALDGAGLLLAAWESPAVQHDLLVRVFRRNGEPVGPETALHAQGYPRSPVAAALSPGRFAVAWEGDFGAVWMRLVDATGSPVGDEVRLDSGTDPAFGVQLAALPAGGLVATWSDRGIQGGSRLWARFFDAEGRQAGDAKAIALFASSLPGYFANEAVGVLPDGSFLAFWTSYVFIGLFPPHRQAAHFSATGEPLGEPFDVAPGLLAIGRDGYSISFSWHFPGVSVDSGTDAFVTQYDAAGQALGRPVIFAGGEGFQTERGIGIDESGRLLAVWSEHGIFNPSIGSPPQAGLFNPDATALGAPVTLSASHRPDAVRVVGRGGDWAIGWAGETGLPEAGDLFVRQLTTCVTAGSQLCLADRFRAEVSFQGGAGGHGQAVPLTGDTGAFWFFGPENIELVVKAIDGRALNDHFWIFYGALSNVAYDLTVTDVVTGERKVYHNPAGTMASRADTGAFAAAAEDGILCAAALAPAEAPRQQTAPLSPPPCFNGPENLCLGRPWLQFQVEVAWKIPGTGQTGTGKAVPLTGETGYFWFFSPENVELIVKVLDGQAVNGKYWVFYGALSDVEYTIKVTDKLSGKVKTYHNPAGTMASRADTSAF